MEYSVKSIIIGRKKRESDDDTLYPCFVALFKLNKPHMSGEAPSEILDFPTARKVQIHTMKPIDYMLAGNDLVIEDLAKITIEQHKDVVILNCK